LIAIATRKGRRKGTKEGERERERERESMKEEREDEEKIGGMKGTTILIKQHCWTVPQKT